MVFGRRRYGRLIAPRMIYLGRRRVRSGFLRSAVFAGVYILLGFLIERPHRTECPITPREVERACVMMCVVRKSSDESARQRCAVFFLLRGHRELIASQFP